MATFNFTENAQMALTYAQEEAINMKHRMIGTLTRDYASKRHRIHRASFPRRRLR